jgi:hypothetical protein
MKDVPDEIPVPRKVMKGGSHLYTPKCRRYRLAARMPQAIDTSTSHLSFGCVVRPPTNEVHRHSPEGEKRPKIHKPSGGGPR